jgi:hypothetical protein
MSSHPRPALAWGGESEARARLKAMGEAVAIISVSASAAVGIGGLGAAAGAGSRERRWQSREERIIELRTVLEAAQIVLAALMVTVRESLEEVHGSSRINPSTDIQHLGKGLATERARISVRLGWRSAEYTSFSECWTALSSVINTIVDNPADKLNPDIKSTCQKKLRSRVRGRAHSRQHAPRDWPHRPGDFLVCAKATIGDTGLE